jgi:hypothetical protein
MPKRRVEDVLTEWRDIEMVKRKREYTCRMSRNGILHVLQKQAQIIGDARILVIVM